MKSIYPETMSVEQLGDVARVYVRRMYGYKKDDLHSEEWIKLWSEKSKLSRKDMIQAAWEYVDGGCGIVG